MSGNAYTARAPARGRLERPHASSGPTRPLGVAAACVLLLALVWVVAQLVPAAQLRDAVALHDFTLLSRPHVDTVATAVIHLVEPALFVLWGIAIVGVAIARGRPRVAAAATAVMALAPFTAETLKPLLAHPHAQVGSVHITAASWPSGHATAAAALALSALLVAPARLRPLVAVAGALFALGVGVSLLIEAWHMPSDVLGGYLVAALWAALAVAAVRASERRRATRNPL